MIGLLCFVLAVLLMTPSQNGVSGILFRSETLFSARLFELPHNELPSTVALLANPASCGGSAELKALRGPPKEFP
jgi:hypothetical protein